MKKHNLSQKDISYFSKCRLCFCNDCIDYYNGEEGLFCYEHEKQHSKKEIEIYHQVEDREIK